MHPRPAGTARAMFSCSDAFKDTFLQHWAFTKKEGEAKDSCTTVSSFICCSHPPREELLLLLQRAGITAGRIDNVGWEEKPPGVRGKDQRRDLVKRQAPNQSPRQIVRGKINGSGNRCARCSIHPSANFQDAGAARWRICSRFLPVEASVSGSAQEDEFRRSHRYSNYVNRAVKQVQQSSEHMHALDQNTN